MLKSLLRGKNQKYFWKEYVLRIKSICQWLSWLESRRCGINQRVPEVSVLQGEKRK